LFCLYIGFSSYFLSQHVSVFCLLRSLICVNYFLMSPVIWRYTGVVVRCHGLPNYRRPPQTTTDYRRPIFPHRRPIFTALHVMQTRYCDEISVRPSVCLSVCLSVRLSHAWIVTKRKKDRSRFIYYTKEHLS